MATNAHHKDNFIANYPGYKDFTIQSIKKQSVFSLTELGNQLMYPSNIERVATFMDRIERMYDYDKDKLNKQPEEFNNIYGRDPPPDDPSLYIDFDTYSTMYDNHMSEHIIRSRNYNINLLELYGLITRYLTTLANNYMGGNVSLQSEYDEYVKVFTRYPDNTVGTYGGDLRTYIRLFASYRIIKSTAFHCIIDPLVVRILVNSGRIAIIIMAINNIQDKHTKKLLLSIIYHNHHNTNESLIAAFSPRIGEGITELKKYYRSMIAGKDFQTLHRNGTFINDQTMPYFFYIENTTIWIDNSIRDLIGK